MEPCDTIVIGAGPVGSHAAYRLARLGYKVLVLEKKASPGDDVCCTGILSKECLDTFDIDDNLILKKYQSAKFFSPSGYCLKLWRDSPVAVVVDRPALDKNLAEKAQRASVEYIFGSKVTDIRAEHDSVEVTIVSNPSLSLRAEGEAIPRDSFVAEAPRNDNRHTIKTVVNRQKTTLKAKTAIIATGFGSALPEKLGLGKIKHFLPGIQAEVYTDIDEVEVYFNQNLAPSGFAWLVPTRDAKGLVGLLASHHVDVHLKAFLNTLSSQGKLIYNQVTPSYGAIPLRPLPTTYTDRILVVGETAGQVKPTTGGGVYYGLLCADIAAEVLHKAFLSGNFSAQKLSAYEKQWRAKLGKELTVGYWSHRLYSCLSNHLIENMFHIAVRNSIDELINNTEDFAFDWHNRLLLQMTSSLLPFAKSIKPL